MECETIALADSLGRWLAEPVLAQRTQPAADLSAMDGYAIRFEDMPGPWRMIGESAAGRPFAGAVGPGDAVRIFTGAAMPPGANTVLIQEEAARDHKVLSLSGEGPLSVGRNVRRRGLDFSQGQVLIETGQKLTPARLAVAATGGVHEVVANRRIRVAIAATGDELVAPGKSATGAGMPESNRLLLRTMLSGLPVDIVDLGILPDRLDVLREAFAGVSADLLVTTGGASVGDHDLVKPALEAAGAEIGFWRIALRPGKPMMAGDLGSMKVLGLPGNPVSVFVTTILFVIPLVAALGGARSRLPRATVAVLGDDLPANGPRTDYLRAEQREGRVFAATVQDSSMLLTLARATCLVVRPADAPAARAGEMVEILAIA